MIFAKDTDFFTNLVGQSDRLAAQNVKNSAVGLSVWPT